MALRTKCVARRLQLLGVWIVAIAAGHTLTVHLALQERTPVVDFVALLAVGMVQRWCQQRRDVVIEKRFAGMVALGDLRATRVTLCADLDFLVRVACLAAHGVAGLRVHRPAHIGAFIQQHGQTHARIAIALGRPRNVVRPRAVARFTADMDLRPGRRELVGRRIVVLPQVRRVAVGAHEIPVLLPARPVQFVVSRNRFVRIEAEPALGHRIPGAR